ncbi:hypothetical protein BaRGS_00019649, partial [Batillaria attramentaria]
MRSHGADVLMQFTGEREEELESEQVLAPLRASRHSEGVAWHGWWCCPELYVWSYPFRTSLAVSRSAGQTSRQFGLDSSYCVGVPFRDADPSPACELPRVASGSSWPRKAER